MQPTNFQIFQNRHLVKYTVALRHKTDAVIYIGPGSTIGDLLLQGQNLIFDRFVTTQP